MSEGNLNRLPYVTSVYWLAIASCTLFLFGGFTLLLSIVSLFIAKKSEQTAAQPVKSYDNYRTLKKGKFIAYIGVVLNVLILAVTVWTLSTIGWDAWSDEFVRRWNEGWENGRRY